MPCQTLSPPQSGPATAPDCPPGHPFSGISCKNHPNPAHFSGKRPLSRIYADRSVFCGAVKTLLYAFPWRNPGKSRVQHMRSKGRAVMRIHGITFPGPDPLTGQYSTEVISVSDRLFFRTVRRQFSKKSHPGFRNRSFQPPFSIPALIPRPEMSTFGNDTRGDYGLHQAGAHPYSRRKQNADTGVFSQGDFCRIGATAGIPGPVRDRPSKRC
jgi:hypothetical protein